jgi:hypothetical protein
MYTNFQTIVTQISKCFLPHFFELEVCEGSLICLDLVLLTSHVEAGSSVVHLARHLGSRSGPKIGHPCLLLFEGGAAQLLYLSLKAAGEDKHSRRRDRSTVRLLK